ncbi:ScbR family autoregulator-binding transcription factor [Kitasatospora sp. NPDC006697]|uniref:ScbR family autoregulator-binding transcription factor n=1 Tax=Kitasatospora sp. NPDC006697 TaxID=3364020 RepID=UPI00368A9779
MARQERAARTRRALIQAAAEVFAEEGFAPASLTVVSRRAGVSNGALHFHFTSKQSLAQGVVGEAVAAVRRVAEAASARVEGGLQGVVGTTHALVGLLAEDPVVRAGFALEADPQWPGSSVRAEWQAWVEGALRRAGQEGLLGRGVTPDGAARTLVAMAVGRVVLGAADPDWLSGQWVDCFLALMLPDLVVEPLQAADAMDANRSEGSVRAEKDTD